MRSYEAQSTPAVYRISICASYESVFMLILFNNLYNRGKSVFGYKLLASEEKIGEPECFSDCTFWKMDFSSWINIPPPEIGLSHSA